MPKSFLTNAELCQLLRCSSSTLWRMRRDIPDFPKPHQFGRRLLWTQEHVEQAIALIL